MFVVKNFYVLELSNFVVNFHKNENKNLKLKKKEIYDLLAFQDKGHISLVIKVDTKFDTTRRLKIRVFSCFNLKAAQ